MGGSFFIVYILRYYYHYYSDINTLHGHTSLITSDLLHISLFMKTAHSLKYENREKIAETQKICDRTVTV